MFKEENVVLDFKGQNVPKKPQHIDIMAKMKLNSIQSFFVIMALCVVTLVSIMFAWKESNRADNNIKVAWVKMYPNGTWDIEFHDEHREPEFFQATIDYILTQWVERRYSEIPHSVQNDYGFVYLFMSPKLRSDFVSPEGFNAPAKAAKIAECNACREIKFKVRNIDHYDSDRTKFGENEGVLYRTNVFVQRTSYTGDGSPEGSDKMIVPVQWRIKSKNEIQAEKGLLKQNPIGLEIMEYDLLKDVS